MNKEVEKICAKVEQMKKRIMDGWKSLEGHISSSSRGALEALNEVLSVINSLPKTPYTDELYDASELHSSSYGRHEIMENPYSSVQFAFESGAQWMEEKLLENGVKYGVKPGETDFGGAIKRSLNEGVKYIGKEFLKMIYDTRR